MPDSNYYQSRKDSVKIKDEKMSRSNSRTRDAKYQHRRDDSREGRSGDRKKKDRRKGRSRTRSVSSDSSLDNEAKFDKLLDKKRLQKLEEEKERKRRMKELETPDEKRARRIAKKLQKEERRRTNALSAFPDGIPYTDLNNPFNDNNLTETFVWNKKWETEGKAGISRKKVEKINRDTIAKNFAEMEQLKRNREARDSAREDMEMIARDQERRQCDWNRTEDIFHLNQARLRSSIRIKEGRGKPIDYLARYISYMDENNKDGEEEFQLDNPLSYLPNDSVEDFEDLIADIKIYRVIDGQKNKIYWDDIEIVAKSGLKKLVENRRRSMDSGTVHSSVQEEVNKIFKGKSYDELEQLESQIQAKIKNASKGTDVSYWEALLDQLRPFMAKQRLKELHVKMQQERLRRIRAEQIAEMETLEKKEIEEEEAMEEDEEQKNEEEEEDLPTSSSAIKQKEERKGDKELMETEEVKKFPPKFEYDPNVFVQPEGLPPMSNKTLLVTCADMLKMEDEQREQAYLQLENRGQLEQFSLVCYEQGGYSPSYGSQSHTMPGIEILDEAEDANRMREIRTKNRAQASGGQALNGKDQQMMEIAKKGMTNDEAEFSVEEALEKQHFLWSDKYRPRKPRYFNRVHTGFDWNKYNQTHYDIDNPPPKIVQGYRFNIFYSDLLDPSHTPTFTLTRCEDPDFAIIRFRSGPPYEDIAFKIVNREWEISWKHGYKCQFQNGVFQLWFFFKRYRYRR